MDDLIRLTQAVRQYSSRYHILHFEISEAYDLSNDWQDYFPHTEECGCYAFFDHARKLIYIGKASCGSTIGTRVGTYQKWNKGILERTGSADWRHEPRYLYTIPVHEAHQAPSLEEYLIEVLHPPVNAIWRGRI